MDGHVGIKKGAFQLGLNWWNTWQEQSVNRRIFAAMVTVGGFTTLVKLAAAAKEIVIAYQFGTSDDLDAFLIALVIPAFALTVIGGSLNAALIPTYIQVREQEGQRAAQRLLSNVMALSITFLVALSVVLALAASYILPLVASGFSAEKLVHTHSLYYALLPTLILSGLATTWAAILNAESRFALAAVVPVTTAIVTVLVVVILAKQWGSFALVLGVVGGMLIEMGLLGWGLRRAGISPIPRWYGTSPAVKKVLGQYVPMVAGAFLLGSADVVSQSMAAILSPGSVSALAYGNKLTGLLLGIGGLAVSTAVLPHLSHLVAKEDWLGIKHTLFTYSRLILMAMIPLVSILIYFSEPMVALLFQRGAFTNTDTHLVGRLQVMYLLQVPWYVVSMLLVKLISAAKANHLLMWGALISLIANITLTYLLMRWFDVVGIALATSTMYLTSFIFLAFAALRLIKEKVNEQR